jgi:hypothetical protein
MPKTVQLGEPDRDLYFGLIRLHILHNAAEKPIFGAGDGRAVAGHAYRCSPGTLYPSLHGLEMKAEVFELVGVKS